MNPITAIHLRLDRTADLPALLDAAWDAFEVIRVVLRHYQERAGAAFPAFVLAAGAAADGRDQIAGSASLPAAVSGRDAAAADLAVDGGWADAAAEVAALCDALAGRLSAASADAAGRDRTACLHGARHAARISSLLSGAGRT
jgi:hypothetical protein